jgi:MoaA/NifB/PqqE/SkfB family radical SAM enzyme
LTYRCNLKCKICNIWRTPFREELNAWQVAEIFQNLKNLVWLDLIGGEITLREDLIEVIKLIADKAPNLLIFHISTNGQLPEKVFLLAKEILHYRMIPVINVSVDGPAQINDSIRGCEGAYSKSLKTFNLLKKFSKGYYYLSCTISDHNIDHIDKFLSELEKDVDSFSSSDLHFNIFHSSAHYYKNQDIAAASLVKFKNLEKYLKLSRKGSFVKQKLEDLYIAGLRRYLSGDKFFINCQALGSTCFINPYGEVYPCGIYDRSVGDLTKNGYDLNKIWRETETLKTRDDIKEKKCPGCWSPCEAYPALLGDLKGAYKLLAG